jgi:hypothetical protein
MFRRLQMAFAQCQLCYRVLQSWPYRLCVHPAHTVSSRLVCQPCFLCQLLHHCVNASLLLHTAGTAGSQCAHSVPVVYSARVGCVCKEYEIQLGQGNAS